jgi:Predicted ATPase (AAA+ superfamily)
MDLYKSLELHTGRMDKGEGMFIRRTAQLRLLEEQYTEAGNNLVVLYGRKGMGKTTLLSQFLEGKPSIYYYEGSDCAEKLQLFLAHRQESLPDNADQIPSFSSLFSEMSGLQEGKRIIALDEFQYIIKNDPDFIDSLQLLGNREQPVMFILSSSSIRFVENDMIGILGDRASDITASMKLKEFSFVDLVNLFPKSSVETCIYINAVLGGIPEYLSEWRQEQTVSENIINLILSKNGRLFAAPQQFLKLELREPAVYNTILYYLSQGNRKLNQLHQKTGYSRAKISVYLKNLIELDLVEKLVPLSEEGKENAQKGLYRIRDNFMNFWYRFVFPNISELMLQREEEVYRGKIAPCLNDYMGEYFADVCTEFLKLMNLHDRLPEKILWWDRWYGKNGTIDILAQSESGKTLAGKCLWQDRKAEYQDYEALVSLIQEAEKSPDYCYLFSRDGFTEEFTKRVKESKNIILIGLEDL